MKMKGGWKTFQAFLATVGRLVSLTFVVYRWEELSIAWLGLFRWCLSHRRSSTGWVSLFVDAEPRRLRLYSYPKQNCTVGQLDARRETLGNRAHATVRQLTASTNANGSHAPRARGRERKKERPMAKSLATEKKSSTVRSRAREKDLALAAATAADAGKSTGDTITPQLGALPRVE